MQGEKKQKDDISVYIHEQEFIANTYVMRCFSVTMLVYTVTFLMNLVGIFIVDQRLMTSAYVSSLIIYLIVWFVAKKVLSSSRKLKYFMLTSIIVVFTITGIFLTYHAILIALLPFLYAMLYSSKKVMYTVYVLTVISTIVMVYGGYYFGLCDANMALLTSTSLDRYLANGIFTLTEVNSSPFPSLLIFYAMPRCLIYIAFVAVCNNIQRILNGSLEKARLTDELEQAKVDAENASRAKSQFLARMSHEIRTPINAVMGMNEMILQESREENIRRYAGDVKNSSVVLLNIINEILDASKIESGKMELVEDSYEMVSILNDIYNMIHIKAEEKNLELVFDIDTSMPKAYFGDEKRIKQILLNLLTNAVKYTEKGQVTLQIREKEVGGKAVLRYCVKDTGIGIREEDISRIYDAFQRVDMSRNKYIEGTGLGMNITQQFLKLMGSELQIRSEYEKGSEFSFELEQRITNIVPMGEFVPGVIEQAKPSVKRISYWAPEVKILVVDDQQMNLKVAKGLLKNTGIQVWTAESGKECLDIMGQQEFHMVFMDHMMPEMDGIETFHAMKEGKLCEGVPVVMLTANAIRGDREKYLEEGFDDFLSKPIMPAELDKMIMQYIPERYFTRTESALPVTKPQEKTEDIKSENQTTDIQENNLTEDMQRENLTADMQAENQTADMQAENHTKDEEIQEKMETEEKSVLDRIAEELPQIDIQRGLVTCCGEESFYLELLNDFSRLTVKEDLEAFLQEGDYKNYCIRIHGFKNNAYSIGATALGDLSFEMEKLTKQSMSEEIYALHTQFIEQYDDICRKYNRVKEENS